ncbi:PREDICTED: putative tripartite motif-containing protein 43C-like [Chrysochloris asiatica]|uniref:Tripartite motif-containing protein 43C-like n=1 Tax=Chrysochloris asiatica TaxID=185453 RepID=A0A9B0T7Z6_CHRAS|nr:PREDICTED: putative tripartite motif-containing protein 43C-like [Chrysochloris asiatica]
MTGLGLTGLLGHHQVESCKITSFFCFLHSQEQTCGAHKKTKMIFCEASKNLLCVLISNFQEHEGHSHYSIGYATEDYQGESLRANKKSNHYKLLNTSPMIFLHIEKHLMHIGVSVDFDNKSVSFINVYKSSIICLHQWIQ